MGRSQPNSVSSWHVTDLANVSLLATWIGAGPDSVETGMQCSLTVWVPFTKPRAEWVRHQCSNGGNCTRKNSWKSFAHESNKNLEGLLLTPSFLQTWDFNKKHNWSKQRIMEHQKKRRKMALSVKDSFSLFWNICVSQKKDKTTGDEEPWIFAPEFGHETKTQTKQTTRTWTFTHFLQSFWPLAPLSELLLQPIEMTNHLRESFKCQIVDSRTRLTITVPFPTAALATLVPLTLVEQEIPIPLIPAPLMVWARSMVWHITIGIVSSFWKQSMPMTMRHCFWRFGRVLRMRSLPLVHAQSCAQSMLVIRQQSLPAAEPGWSKLGACHGTTSHLPSGPSRLQCCLPFFQHSKHCFGSPLSSIPSSQAPTPR